MKKKWTLNDLTELHMRPAMDLCTIALEYESKITLRFDNCEYDAKSLLSVLSSCVQKGDEVEIEVEGPDEKEAMERISAFFDNEG